MSNRLASQAEMILAHLKTGASIEPLEALDLYGCFRLGARIWDLKEAGHNISTEIVRDGDKHWARYRLIPEGEGPCSATSPSSLSATSPPS